MPTRRPAAKTKALALARIEAGELVVTGAEAEPPLRVTLVNPSTGRVRGRWMVRLGDGTAISVEPGPQLSADLAPGATVVRELRVRLPATRGRQWLQVVGDERTSFSAAVPVLVPAVVAMPRLPAGSPLDSGLDIGVEHAGTPILTGRAAVVGDNLALELAVRDAAMRVDRVSPWLGASVEVFAGPEPRAGIQAQPNQIILIPDDAQGPAEVRPGTGSSVPVPGWEVMTIPGGWRARVQVPLSVLRVDPAAAGFRFDIICNAASPIAGQNFLKLARWGSLGNFANSLGLAKVELRCARVRGRSPMLLS